LPPSRFRWSVPIQTGLLVACVAAPVRPAAAATLQVPAAYRTIQAAIDAAGNGDLVLIAPGVYTENLTLSNRNITLASRFLTTGDRSLIDQTIIDGRGSGWVIRVLNSPATPTIVGLTLRHADDGVRAYGKLYFLDDHVTGTGDGLDYESGGGGLVHGCVFDGNSDDGIDFDGVVPAHIENNTIQNNGDDGIEIRLQPYTGPTVSVVIRNNRIEGNDEDGIQLISYDVLTSRTYWIDGNLILNNRMAGLGIMCCQNTVENFQGANMKERVGVFDNTFVGNDYGITGGDSVIAINNIFAGCLHTGLKNVDAGSIATHNLFHGNATDHTQSNVDLATTLYADPMLLADYEPASASPAIDAGIASYARNGVLVWSRPSTEFFGPAPDLGAVEGRAVLAVGPGDPRRGIELLPPSPSPSRGQTLLRVELPATGPMLLEILDVTGRSVRRLHEGVAAPGRHEYTWDGRNSDGAAVRAGVYFARLRFGRSVLSRTIALVR
jgi:hypothetical protein